MAVKFEMEPPEGRMPRASAGYPDRAHSHRTTLASRRAKAGAGRPGHGPHVRAGRLERVRRLGHAGYVRTWPEPYTTNLYVVSSGRAMGPRACSFWVEMPISAPMPNSPPSVNRVDAFTRTAAAST